MICNRLKSKSFARCDIHSPLVVKLTAIMIYQLRFANFQIKIPLIQHQKKCRWAFAAGSFGEADLNIAALGFQACLFEN